MIHPCRSIVTAAPRPTGKPVTRAVHGSVVFDGFEETKDKQSRKRWFASTGTSLVILIILGGVGVVLASQASPAPHREPEIDVSFQSMPEEEAAKKPPPPPPPPPKTQQPRAKRPGKVAPPTVTAIPEERPSEAEPTGQHMDAEPIEEFGEGGELGGMPQDLRSPAPPPPPPPPKIEEGIPDPIQEVDPTFTAARPRGSNLLPAYPEKMRHKGVEAEVVLKIEISETGDVVDVQVVRGDEPFLTAAIDAVKTWKYSPAIDDGTPVASTRVVRIPFRLNAR